jgi:excisionase family DNA binding protein
MTDPPATELITVGEAAHLLGCTDGDVYQLINDEQLTVHRIDRVVHLERQQIERLLER